MSEAIDELTRPLEVHIFPDAGAHQDVPVRLFLHSDDLEHEYVGDGETLDEAIRDALREAIEKAMGRGDGRGADE